MKLEKKHILLIIKGYAMGAADVIPGVSGGTIAFITGIYEELISSIKSINIVAIKLLFTFKLNDFWKHINGNFLMAVCSGVALAILSLAKIMTVLLTEYPIFVWSFFFGLIIASSLLVAKDVKKLNFANIVSFLIGVTIAYYITKATPSQTPDNWWFIVLSGAIAICAMILPGISGSFILLLMGKYMYIMDAISHFRISVIALFATGATIGIISFSHILSWLLKKYPNITVTLLTGFMVGSLNKVWPWKKTIETYINSHGDTKPLIEANVLPNNYEVITQNDAYLTESIILCLLGFSLIWGIELIAKKLKK